MLRSSVSIGMCCIASVLPFWALSTLKQVVLTHYNTISIGIKEIPRAKCHAGKPHGNIELTLTLETGACRISSECLDSDGQIRNRGAISYADVEM